MQIHDGAGTSYTAKVDKNNKLTVYAVTEVEDLWANEDFGLAFIFKSFATPETQNPSVSSLSTTCFAYLKNTKEQDLIISQIKMWVENSPEAFDIYFNHLGTPVGGTTSTPANMNLGSGNSTNGTFLTGVDITGLSGGTFFDRLRIPADNENHIRMYPSCIIIPKNNIISFHALTGGQAVELSVLMFYHPTD